VTVLHPRKSFKTPPVPVKSRTIITPERFAKLYPVLPDVQSQLVEMAIESGLRWGELTELRVLDIEFATRMLTVSRAVVPLTPRFHPRWRTVPGQGVSEGRGVPAVQAQRPDHGNLRAHIAERGLGREDLIFQAPPLDEPRIRKLRLVTDPESLGRT
jgi:hypothetical protein